MSPCHEQAWASTNKESDGTTGIWDYLSHLLSIGSDLSALSGMIILLKNENARNLTVSKHPLFAIVRLFLASPFHRSPIRSSPRPLTTCVVSSSPHFGTMRRNLITHRATLSRGLGLRLDKRIGPQRVLPGILEDPFSSDLGELDRFWGLPANTKSSCDGSSPKRSPSTRVSS